MSEMLDDIRTKVSQSLLCSFCFGKKGRGAELGDQRSSVTNSTVFYQLLCETQTSFEVRFPPLKEIMVRDPVSAGSLLSVCQAK